MRRTGAVGATALGLLAGCVAAERVPTTPVTATGEGLTVAVEGMGWPALIPAAVDVLPVRVRLANQGRYPVRIQYDQFVLARPDGGELPPIPPLPLEAATPVKVDYALPAQGFYVAGYLAERYAGLPPWPGDLSPSPVHWSDQPNMLRRLELPQVALAWRGLPEGVLMPGGSITGLLYFPQPEPSVYGIPLEALRVEVVTPEGAQVGAVSLTVPEAEQLAAVP